ncbi:hypothetical protein AMBLS11_14880 [Alteromonas macleodii str. 'Black Sea 11']|nr:hypothetical protein AMBLS11_14880 [Alteromonas macleodii str. 'Black Sea 11']
MYCFPWYIGESTLIGKEGLYNIIEFSIKNSQKLRMNAAFGRLVFQNS